MGMRFVPKPKLTRWTVLQISSLICWGCRLVAGQPGTSVQGYSPDQNGLIYMKRSIPNFDIYIRRAQCTGWSEKPGANVCTWPGVTCMDGKVIGLHFLNNGSALVGNIGDVLYGASLIPNMQKLDMSGQAFTGPLPNNSVSFPVLQSLNLANNFIQGPLPAQWGLDSAFPVLKNLTLSFNPTLNGTLPAAWGSDNSSFKSLTLLEMNNCNLTGTLPATWANTLPALQNLNVSSNLLTGTLPAAWSTLNLTMLNLDRNLLVGTIPLNWGAGGSFSSLKRMQLYANNLTGQLPLSWSINGTMPKLGVIDVAKNSLTGSVPSGWGQPGQSFFVTDSGNALCGPMPDYQVYNCGYFRRDCQKNSGISATCPAPAPPAPPADIQGATGDLAVLLQLKRTFFNFDTVSRSEDSHWDSSMAMCQWQGVTCNPQGNVQALNFSISTREPPVLAPLTNGYDNTIVHASVEIQLQGDVGEVLQVLSKLPALSSVDFFNQYLTGTLPPNVSFPSLTVLWLVNNNIAGTLPESWGNANAFPLLRSLALNGNFQLTGSLPAGWGSQASSMGKLEVLAMRDCNFTGPLPDSWAANLPTLSVVDLSNNWLSGTLPSSWQSAPALSAVLVTGTNIQGTLPNQWANNGVSSWQYLQELHLDSNLLSGTLPASWGAGGSMGALRNITLTYNNITGSIPAAWSINPSTGKPHFLNLQAITLLPQYGNTDLTCGIVPQGVTVIQKVGSYPAQQVYSLGPTCPQAPVPAPASTTTPAAAPAVAAATTSPGVATAGIGSGSGGPNIGAIVGAVVGVVAAVAVLSVVVFLFARRRRRQRQMESLPMQRRSDRWSGDASMRKTTSLDDKVEALMEFDVPLHDSDSIIPPKQRAPHSYVPFSQSPSVLSSPRRSSAGGGPTSGGTGSRSGTSASGSGTYGSLGTTGSGVSDHMSLPVMPFKDWELNLEALQVELDEEGQEVELGKGAFGVVVKGSYRMAPVAIKRLRDQSPEQQAQFLKEMAILRACRGSRYVVPFVGASLQPGNTILAMDFMDNGNLWDALPRVTKDGRHIFQWHNRGRKVAYEIALGLHFLHDLRVVHLDLKSSNVLLAADGTAKISDVGLAALMGKNYLSHTAPAGTWAWMAPEVILAGKVSQKADIFSFGVVLWEICTLERPAWRGNLRDVRVPEEAPQEIADLLQRCTGDAEQRPDANECADIIAPYVRAGLRPSSRSLSGETPRAPARTGSGGTNPPAARTASGGSTPPIARTGSGGSNPPIAKSGSGSSTLPPRGSSGSARTASMGSSAAPGSGSSTIPEHGVLHVPPV